MNSGRIHKNDLPFLRCQNRLDPVSCRLRFVGCDRNLLPDQIIHQR